MNTRLTLSSALAAAALLALAPAQTQAAGAGDNITGAAQTSELEGKTSELEAKMNAMQSQIDQLKAQVKQLHAQLRARNPSVTISPLYHVPNLTLPDSNGQGKFFPPTIQVLPGTPPFSRNNSIPDYTATFIAQPAH